MRRLGMVAVVTCLMLPPACAEADIQTTVSVSGKSTVYFAGRTSAELTAIATAGGYTDYDFWGDLSGADGGIAPTAMDITGFGDRISITAVGAWSHTNPPNWTGPEGYGFPEVSQSQYGIFGVSLVDATRNSLVGVFLSNDLPDPTATPPALLTGADMTAPELNQAFVIGSGLDEIHVDEGATRLYLGLHNGYEWINNSGSVTATITAALEPTTMVLIDIKPGSDPNSINLKSKGVLPVALLSTDVFDALAVDMDSLAFGDPLLTEGTPVSPLRFSDDDINDDGLLDRLLKFSIPQMLDNGVLDAATEMGQLTGTALLGDINIEGTDAIRVVPGGNVKSIPEPSACLLFLVGMGCFAATRRRLL